VNDPAIGYRGGSDWAATMPPKKLGAAAIKKTASNVVTANKQLIAEHGNRKIFAALKKAAVIVA